MLTFAAETLYQLWKYIGTLTKVHSNKSPVPLLTCTSCKSIRFSHSLALTPYAGNTNQFMPSHGHASVIKLTMEHTIN